VTFPSLCQCHTCCLGCAVCLLSVPGSSCVFATSGLAAVPPPGKGRAALLGESKHGHGVMGGHNGGQSLWGHVLGSGWPRQPVAFRERTSGPSLRLPNCPWMPITGASGYVLVIPHPSKNTTCSFREGGHTQGSHAKPGWSVRVGTAAAWQNRVTRGSAP